MDEMIKIDAGEKGRLADMIRRIRGGGVRSITLAERTRILKLQKYMHPLYRIMAVMDGEYTYRIARNDQVCPATLLPGHLMFCSRYALTMGPERENIKPMTMLTLVFFPQYIRFLISVVEECGGEKTARHYWYHTAAPMSQPGWRVLQALNELVRKDSDTALSAQLMMFMYDYCLAQLLDDREEAGSKSLLTYHRIKSCMVENMHLPINREQVARMLGLNPSHISKLFNRYDKLNFNSSLKAMRMELALELVRENYFSIDEITEQCGFVNTGYFIKSFREFYGKTPGAFRTAR
jgi:AraC-like DNA-binding protein